MLLVGHKNFLPPTHGKEVVFARLTKDVWGWPQFQHALIFVYRSSMSWTAAPDAVQSNYW